MAGDRSRVLGMVVGLATLLLAGCGATLDEIRASRPIQWGEVVGEAVELSRCTTAGMRQADRGVILAKPGNFRWEVVEAAGEQRATVTGYEPLASRPMLDVVFVGGRSRVAVEIRSGGPITRQDGRRTWYGADDVIHAVEVQIERCARSPFSRAVW